MAMPFLTSCGPAFLKKLLKDHPEIVIESIKSHPEKYMEALAEAQRQYVLEKRKKQREKQQADQEEEFKNPKKPEMKSNRVYFGKKSAGITIVEYSDFQCGYCAKSVPTLKQVLKAYPNDVRVLYKHKPLFPGSAKAAEYYEAVGMQDSKKAQDFHDKLFERRAEIQKGDKFLKELAKSVKVDMDQLEKDLSLASATVKADQQEAEKFGFSGTPGFLVGGITVPGALPFAKFKQIIDRHLSMKGKKKPSASSAKAKGEEASAKGEEASAKGEEASAKGEEASAKGEEDTAEPAKK